MYTKDQYKGRMEGEGVGSPLTKKFITIDKGRKRKFEMVFTRRCLLNKNKVKLSDNLPF